MESESIEKKVREALVAELQRQTGSTLKESDDGKVTVNGAFNLDDLALAITGAVAGGP